MWDEQDGTRQMPTARLLRGYIGREERNEDEGHDRAQIPHPMASGYHQTQDPAGRRGITGLYST